MMTLQEAIHHSLTPHTTILFIGAGFSRSARNIRDQELPDGPALCRLLANDIPTHASEGEDDLDVIGDLYVQYVGKHSLLHRLHEIFNVRTTSQNPIALASLPWLRVYTTNYDDAFEFAASQAGYHYIPALLHTPPSDYDFGLPLCVHLNGYVPNIKINNLESHFKLTNQSYLTNTIAESPWSKRFRRDISLSNCVLFAGYSGYDIDGRRILYQIPGLTEKCIFIVGPQPRPSLLTRLNGLGAVSDIGMDCFVSRLREEQAVFEKPNTDSMSFICISRYEAPQQIEHDF